MEVLVVYESLFGNTEAVARAVADGIRGTDPSATVSVLPVGEAGAPWVAAADLLVVGAPTHLRGMPTPRTRTSGRRTAEQRGEGADDRAGPSAPELGVREWMAGLPPASPGRSGAAFCTRLGTPLSGSAARRIARRLHRLGYGRAAEPGDFIVKGGTGPLSAGQEERARAWGAALVRQPVR